MNDNSEKIIEIISAYLDGEVSAEEKAEVENLLQINREAVAVYERLSSARNLLNQFENVEAPIGFKKRIISTISLSRKRSFFQRLSDMVAAQKIKVPILSYAGAAIVLFILVFYYLATSTLFPQIADESAEEFVYVDPKAESKDTINEDIAPGLLAEAPEKEEKPQEELNTNQPAGEDLAEAGKLDGSVSTESTFAESEGRTRPMPTVSDEQALQADRTFTESETQEIPAFTPSPLSRQRAELKDKTTGSVARSVNTIETSLVFTNPIYKAEIIQAFPSVRQTTAARRQKGKSKSEEFVIESGQGIVLSGEAEIGSDQNPISSIENIAVPFPDIQFASLGSQSDFGSVLVYGEIHIGTDGSVRYYRLSGHENGRLQIESFARYLRTARIMPAIYQSKEVSVYFSFIVALSRSDQMAD